LYTKISSPAYIIPVKTLTVNVKNQNRQIYEKSKDAKRKKNPDSDDLIGAEL